VADRTAPVKQPTRHSSDQELDPKVITAKIARTRREMSATIAAIVDRLSPERLANEALAAVTKEAEQADRAADALATDAINEATAAARKLIE
jgi:hypothetical protein